MAAMNRFEITKRTGTHADVLAAVGTADVLLTMKPRLKDLGTSFGVCVPRDANIDDLATGPGFKYLKIAVPPSQDNREIIEISVPRHTDAETSPEVLQSRLHR